MKDEQTKQHTILKTHSEPSMSIELLECQQDKTQGDVCSHLQQNSSPVVDDILSRMDKLRALASMQRRKSKSSKRQQYSFCF